NFDLKLDENLPKVPINEFVVWEIMEPLIQNSIDHAKRSDIRISIITSYNTDSKTSQVQVIDNGRGIAPDLLELNERGIKRIFQENVSTKDNSEKTGYGCYLAYEISKQRCGWNMDAENLKEGGCCFTITIPN
ncbi:MAG: ATP-binding protein, partial [Calditrichaeota bacterium]